MGQMYTLEGDHGSYRKNGIRLWEQTHITGNFFRVGHAGRMTDARLANRATERRDSAWRQTEFATFEHLRLKRPQVGKDSRLPMDGPAGVREPTNVTPKAQQDGGKRVLLSLSRSS